jgi:hypothetical protein
MASSSTARADQLGISGSIPKPFKENQIIDKAKAEVNLVAKASP